VNAIDKNRAPTQWRRRACTIMAARRVWRSACSRPTRCAASAARGHKVRIGPIAGSAHSIAVTAGGLVGVADTRAKGRSRRGIDSIHLHPEELAGSAAKAGVSKDEGGATPTEPARREFAQNLNLILCISARRPHPAIRGASRKYFRRCEDPHIGLRSRWAKDAASLETRRLKQPNPKETYHESAPS